MKMNSQVAAIAALARGYRLAVFRLPMRNGPNGLSPGDFATRLGVRGSTLSSRSAQMERAGLARSARRRRNIFCSVHVEGTRRLIRFLTEDCSESPPELGGFLADGPTSAAA
jgi:DNA-binding transcriptional ArsR family regulator